MPPRERIHLRGIEGRLVADGMGPLPDHAGNAGGAASARVLFRPSDVVLCPADAEGGWPGKVAIAQYLGRQVQYLVRCGEHEVTVEVPSHGGVFAEGTAVTLRVVPGGLFVFAEDA